MTRLFAYGSLKQGFTNQHRNRGQRLPGSYRTRERLPMVLLGAGHVPWVIYEPGTGHQVVGEVYRMEPQGMVITDKLERFGEPSGYKRVEIELERTDVASASMVKVLIYVRLPSEVPPDTPRIGPLPEYTMEHARSFVWTGAD